MGSDDFIELDPPGVSNDQGEAVLQVSDLEIKDGIPNGESMHSEVGRSEDDEQRQTLDHDGNAAPSQNQTSLLENVELTATITVMNEITGVKSGPVSENGGTVKPNDDAVISDTVHEHYISGIKRARRTYNEQQPSVRVIYNSLTRDSKRKLEVLLQQWSEWHAQRVSPSNEPSKEGLENGDEIFFPALNVGKEKPSTVSFWMDFQARLDQNKDGDLVPLYDRGYAFGLTSLDGSANPERGAETFEASRCFNCGSYNHSLKECPKPRDNAAVNNARKLHNSKRNPASGPRLPIRYYQNSPGGKFEGLKPGILGAEARQCLGIGEFDPPPWLNRMREIGYPPGYLEAQGQPSGITIFADEEKNEEHEDGEILEEGEAVAPEKKMTVEFPGINAPVPENADQRRWAQPSGPSSSDSYRNRSHGRLNRSSESNREYYNEERWSRDYKEPAPPGVDFRADHTISSFSQRNGNHDSNYSFEPDRPISSFSHRHDNRGINYSFDPQSPNGDNTISTPNLGRSFSDRGWRGHSRHDYSPLRYEDRNEDRHRLRK